MSNPNQLPLKISLHFSFFIVGIVTFILGSILPIIANNLKLNDEQSGFFSTSQFYGSIIGTISTAFLIRTIGFVKTVGIGFLLFAIGLSGVNFRTWVSGSFSDKYGSIYRNIWRGGKRENSPAFRDGKRRFDYNNATNRLFFKRLQ